MPFLPGQSAELAAHKIHRTMPGQDRQVGAQCPGLRVIPSRVAPQVHEHILHDVLGGGAVTQNVQRRTIYRGREAVEDLRERKIVSGRQARRQKRVRSPHTPDGSPATGGKATGDSQSDRRRDDLAGRAPELDPGAVRAGRRPGQSDRVAVGQVGPGPAVRQRDRVPPAVG